MTDHDYASSTVPPSTFNSWDQHDWDEYDRLMMLRPSRRIAQITMESSPMVELMHDAKRYVVNGLAGIGALAAAVLVGLAIGGYFR